MKHPLKHNTLIFLSIMMFYLLYMISVFLVTVVINKDNLTNKFIHRGNIIVGSRWFSYDKK